MKILIINPNTSEEMTQAIYQSAVAVKQESTEITAVNPPHGPECVEGSIDELTAAYHLIDIIKTAEATGDYDAYIVACFGDPAVEALRELTDKPVVGVAEAAMRLAPFISGKFAIVSILPRCLVHLEELAHRYGVSHKLTSIKTPNIGVLEFHTDQAAAEEKLVSAAREAVEREYAEAIILGCAGMSGFSDFLSQKIGVPVLDSVSCAVKIAEGLVDLSLTTSKRNTYAVPTEKLYK